MSVMAVDTPQKSTISFTKYSSNMRGAVVKNQTKIYIKANATATIIATPKFGEKMILKAGSTKWYKVKYNGQIGYIRRYNVVKYNRKKKHIALTFDDGPNSATTGIVLKALKDNNCRATFFVLGNRINSSTKKLIKRAYNQKCEIGNHSYSHPSLNKLSSSGVKSQLSKTDKKVKDIIGKKPAICRAPYGAYNKTVLNAMKRPNIFWAVDTLDWKYRDTNRLISYVKSHAGDGRIVLMHDIHATTAKAVNSICKGLKNKGYEMVTVTELSAIKGKKMKSGNTYSRF
jgi:peptidoglycan/xylan/chitin deacetylase (PgdA/CDA1 family)